MNYVWEYMINAKQKGLKEDSIQFQYGIPFSGYMELSLDNLNERDFSSEIEINPYYRYYKIFKKLFDPDFEENKQLVDVIFDLVIHHLNDIDVLMGMSKRQYHIKFVTKELKAGIWGNFVKEKMKYFSENELKILANHLLILFQTADSLYLFGQVVSKIFENAYIFSNTTKKEQIIVFLRTEENKEKAEKIEVIRLLFLPVHYSLFIYWETIFGVMEIDVMMKQGEFLNY